MNSITLRDYNKPYISIVERTDGRYFRRRVILHNGLWHFFSCDTEDQLANMAKTLGFTYTLRDERNTTENGLVREYDIDRAINDRNLGFWHRSDVPEDAMPIMALSNGSTVTCYFTNDGETITMYRPNPNAREVYHPLPLHQHIAHALLYGTI